MTVLVFWNVFGLVSASRSQSIDRHSKMGGRGRGLLGDGCICARINSNRHSVITQVLGLLSDLNVY